MMLWLMMQCSSQEHCNLIISYIKILHFFMSMILPVLCCSEPPCLRESNMVAIRHDSAVWVGPPLCRPMTKSDDLRQFYTTVLIWDEQERQGKEEEAVAEQRWRSLKGEKRRKEGGNSYHFPSTRGSLADMVGCVSVAIVRSARWALQTACLHIRQTEVVSRCSARDTVNAFLFASVTMKPA